MPHLHPVYDTDPHFIIDPDSRQITYSGNKPVILIQNDHKSEHFTFELPREIDGHDMTSCDLVQVHYINIGSSSARNPGLYEITDLQLAEDNSVVVCSWEITQNATSIAGSLSFMLRFACTTDGKIDYAWNTAIFSGITVSPGINNTEIVATEYADILAQWYEKFSESLTVKQTKTRNLLSAEFEWAHLIDADGAFTDNSESEVFNAAQRSFTPVNPNTSYTFSYTPRPNATLTINVYEYTNSGDDYMYTHHNIGNVATATPERLSHTITTSAETKYIRVSLTSWESDNLSDLVPDDFQMELGTEATSYVSPIAIDNSLIDLSTHPDAIHIVEKLGEVDAALDGIIAIQNSLIGGEGV